MRHALTQLAYVASRRLVWVSLTDPCSAADWRHAEKSVLSILTPQGGPSVSGCGYEGATNKIFFIQSL